MQDTDLASLLLRALRYEHWLRYYFAEDPAQDDDGMMDDIPMDGGMVDEEVPAELHVPAVWENISHKEEPEFYPILSSLQHRRLTMDGSRDAVLKCVARIKGTKMGDPVFTDAILEITNDAQFRRSLDFFHSWVQEMADGDEVEPEAHIGNVPLFSRWESYFHIWSARTSLAQGSNNGALF